MPNDRQTIAHEWFEQVWNQGDERTIDRLMAEGAIAHGLADAAGGQVRGPAGFKPFFRMFREAFPDLHIVVEDTVVEGDKVVARCTVRGTHRGDNLGFAATDKAVTFTGICIVRVLNGQIVEAWNNFDFGGMHSQLQAQ
jgi:steroid delta-isomerase-like uncharacterized protein